MSISNIYKCVLGSREDTWKVLVHRKGLELGKPWQRAKLRFPTLDTGNDLEWLEEFNLVP